MRLEHERVRRVEPTTTTRVEVQRALPVRVRVLDADVRVVRVARVLTNPPRVLDVQLVCGRWVVTPVMISRLNDTTAQRETSAQRH